MAFSLYLNFTKGLLYVKWDEYKSVETNCCNLQDAYWLRTSHGWISYKHYERFFTLAISPEMFASDLFQETHTKFELAIISKEITTVYQWIPQLIWTWILENQIRRTGFLAFKNQFQTWFLQAAQAVKSSLK